MGRNTTTILAQPNHKLLESRIPTTKSSVMVESIGLYSNHILQIALKFDYGPRGFIV